MRTMEDIVEGVEAETTDMSIEDKEAEGFLVYLTSRLTPLERGDNVWQLLIGAKDSSKDCFGEA